MFFINTTVIVISQKRIKSLISSHEKIILNQNNIINTIKRNAKVPDGLYKSVISGELIHLSSIIGDSTKLIMYFKESNCFSCVDSALNKIKRLAKLNDGEVIILTDISEYNKLKFIIEQNKIKYRFYSSNSVLSLPYNECNVPILFYLDKNLIAHWIYLYDDGTSENLMDLYFLYSNNYFIKKTSF